jgi:hypothetical protein
MPDVTAAAVMMPKALDAMLTEYPFPVAFKDKPQRSTMQGPDGQR